MNLNGIEIPGHISDLLPYIGWALFVLSSFGRWIGRTFRAAIKDIMLLVLLRIVLRHSQPPVTTSAPTTTLAPPPVSHTAPPLPTDTPPPAPHITPPAPQTQQPTPPAAVPGIPPWTVWSLGELGQSGPEAEARYIRLGKTGGTPGEAWCADFMNAALESVGITGTHSASSQSFRSNSNFVQLPGPALGAIAVFWRHSPNSGLGHVCQYYGERGDHVWCLGGNEQSMVQIEALPKQSSTFALIGYWWPRSVPLPTIGPVILPATVPTHIQVGTSVPSVAATPGTAAPPTATKFLGITATVFAGPNDSAESRTSAYTGKLIDSALPGVALPFHFHGTRPKVIVTNPLSDKSVACDIVDVGPWNTNDPYWEKKDARPQAESGTDLSGRKTNKAGIDLTPAAAAAIGIDGEGLVDWQFAT